MADGEVAAIVLTGTDPAFCAGLDLDAVASAVASERARFADTHSRVGLHPSGGLTVLLPRHVGLRNALGMSLAG